MNIEIYPLLGAILTEYLSPTGGITEQEIFERFPAFSLPGNREKGGTHAKKTMPPKY